MADHLRFNLINFAMVGTMAAVFIFSVTYLLIWLDQRQLPLLSPIAHALLRVYTLAPKN